VYWDERPRPHHVLGGRRTTHFDEAVEVAMSEYDSERAITLVDEGMHAVDADGKKVGTVKEVRLGDPDAVTAEGQVLDDDGPPAGVAERLLRTGYLRLHKGLFGGDRWVSAEDVAAVDDDSVVHLAVPADRLIQAR
jgi:hypothetical protein